VRVLRNIGALATCRAEGGQGDIHVIERGAVVWQDDSILWVGREAELPMVHETAESEDCGGRLVVPGLVDCHTHLAFGGWRAGEFERRIRGESYLEIAQSGGGIAATVRATRAASEDELVSRAKLALAGIISSTSQRTYASRRSRNSGGTTWAPRKVATMRLGCSSRRRR
jgi:imidazolonepropionase